MYKSRPFSSYYLSCPLSYHSSLDHAIQWILATKNRLIKEHRSKFIARHPIQESSSGRDVLTLSVTKELDEALRDVRYLLYRNIQSDAI